MTRRYVHKILCGPEITPKLAFQSGQKQNILPAPIEVISNISGHIVSITDTLDKYQSRSQSSLQQSLIGTSSILHDIPELQRQIAYLSVLIKEIPESISGQFKDGSLNRAWEIPESSSYAKEPLSGTVSKIWKADEVAKKILDEIEEASKKAFRDGSFPTLEETIASLILIACTNLPLESMKEIKLFLSSSGLVGFAPENVVVGDMVCTFMKSQTLAIVRQSLGQQNFSIVGIGSNYSRDLDKFSVGPMRTVRGGMMDTGIIPDRLISFYLDLGTLQALCCFNRQAAGFVGYQRNRSKQVRRRLNPYAYY